MTITDQIRAEIERQGISISEFARRAGLHQPTASKWLGGRKTVTIETAERAAAALGMCIRLFPVGAQCPLPQA